jgi:hypothetical protein
MGRAVSEAERAERLRQLLGELLRAGPDRPAEEVDRELLQLLSEAAARQAAGERDAVETWSDEETLALLAEVADLMDTGECDTISIRNKSEMDTKADNKAETGLTDEEQARRLLDEGAGAWRSFRSGGYIFGHLARFFNWWCGEIDALLGRGKPDADSEA